MQSNQLLLFLLSLLTLSLLSCGRAVVREGVEIELSVRFENYDYKERPERLDSVPWVEVIRVHEIYPLIPMVYFEAGVDTISPFYTEPRYPYRPEAADSLLPGGTIMKNSYLLDILGWRLANATIGDLRLGPTYTTEASESSGLSWQRAERVRDYLVDEWGIDSSRLPIATPCQVSCPDGDTTCPDDLRGVRLSSEDPRLLRTITIIEVRRFEMVEQFRVTLRVSGNHTMSENAELVWRRKGGVLTRFPLRRSAVTIEKGKKSEVYAGSFGFEDTLLRPRSQHLDSRYPDTAFAFATLAIDGRAYESRSVKFVEREVVPWTTRNLHDRGPVYRFALILFERDSASIGAAGMKALRDHVIPVLDTLERITITGHHSSGESPEIGLRRAEAVRDAMVATGVDLERFSEVVVQRWDNLIYLPETPQGRALQRTVEITLRMDWHR